MGKVGKQNGQFAAPFPVGNLLQRLWLGISFQLSIYPFPTQGPQRSWDMVLALFKLAIHLLGEKWPVWDYHACG